MHSNGLFGHSAGVTVELSRRQAIRLREKLSV
jgi:hypothetical protein